MASLFHLARITLVLLLVVQSGSAIRCYYCNSANNSACVDVRLFEEYNLIPVVECEASIPSDGQVRFFCRKIVQTILNAHGKEPELRITRGCGWIPHHNECYRADNAAHTETVCQCFTDECNGAPTTRPAILNVVLPIAAVTAWVVRIHLY